MSDSRLWVWQEVVRDFEKPNRRRLLGRSMLYDSRGPVRLPETCGLIFMDNIKQNAALQLFLLISYSRVLCNCIPLVELCPKTLASNPPC